MLMMLDPFSKSFGYPNWFDQDNPVMLVDLVCGGLECWDVYQRFVGTSLMNLDKERFIVP